MPTSFTLLTLMRFISPAFHGILDYLVAIALVAAPALVGHSFNGSNIEPAWLSATNISILTGVLLFLYSLLTAYPDGLVRLIPLKAHLVIDFLAAVALIAAPFVLPGSYGEIGKWSHVGVGAAVIIVVLFTNPSSAFKVNLQRPPATA